MPSARFSAAGFRAGLIGSGVLAPGIALYGAAVGVMAAAAGLSLFESAVFSGVVYAGGAQMASLGAWAEPLPLFLLMLTTLAMNSRYLLLGAALRPWLGHLPAYQTYPTLFVMGDTNWALALREREAGRDDAAFLLGSGLVLWLVWLGATVAGHAFGRLLGQPERFGVDFMLPAFFAAMAVALFRGAASLVPLAAGAVTAVAVERLTGGPWHLLAGALVGSLAGPLLRRDAD